MSIETAPVKRPNFAPLKNVALFMALVNRLIQRPASLPGLAVMYSPSGYGKSYASIYAQNKTGAIRVEVGESWNRKTLVRGILLELGETNPKGTIADLAAQAIRLLGDDPSRPLIIDEADKLVDKGMIELVREIHEHSQAPVLLIGEEMLPSKLLASERVHNRVLEWLPAQPCDIEDCRKLANVFLRDVAIGDPLLDRVRSSGEGRARRVVVTLSSMAEWARNTGSREIPSDWSGEICTGRPPQRKKAG
jgi:hypothetical protein